MKTGIELIADERKRQIEQEGYTAAHDSQHEDSELIKAALAYLTPGDDSTSEYNGGTFGNYYWPWEDGFKVETTKAVWANAKEHELMRVTFPHPSLKDLVKAGALIAAAIDRKLSE